MAVIGKIREKSMLLLIVIGVAMLAFVLGDLFKSGSQFFSDGNQIGEIDGVEITAIEFNERLEQAVTSWEMQNGGAAADAEVELLLEIKYGMRLFRKKYWALNLQN